jgi:hypothetical protein
MKQLMQEMELKYGWQPISRFLKFSRKFEFCSIRNNSREKNRQVGVETSLLEMN